jgi:hypothetical protein
VGARITAVTWTNHDDVPHNVVSTERTFKSPVLDTDGQFTHRFDAAGSYKDFCSIHPRMTGEIVVGKFVDRDRPGYLEAMRGRLSEQLGEQYVEVGDLVCR